MQSSRPKPGTTRPNGSTSSTCSEPPLASALIQMLTFFIQRWSVETTFEQARAHLGMETQRQWNDRAWGPLINVQWHAWSRPLPLSVRFQTIQTSRLLRSFSIFARLIPRWDLLFASLPAKGQSVAGLAV